MGGRVNQLLFGNEFLESLSNVNILLVGVGGIGCEVLKVMTQFQIGSLHILDLDTIEVSNLNRQFLFRKHHRGQYKALVAAEVLKEDYPGLKIVAHNKNIRDAEFGIKFFAQFQIVIMALDNQETRSFVNKQCMILDIPLIDAGTTGFKGQSFLLKRGETRCYDCFPRAENKKTYPACTIRTLPEKPVHCIIWAKYLFTVLFNAQPEENDEDGSNLLADIAKYISESTEATTDRSNAVSLFTAIFKTDVIRQKEGEDNVKFQHLKVLDVDELNQVLKEKSKGGEVESYVLREDLSFLSSTHAAEVYMNVFVESFCVLIKEKREKGCVVFEKDDNFIMKFITAACNLRCIVFGLAVQTSFEVKEVAGNIVPAIASTNSIVSAIEITEVMKLLQRRFFNNERSCNRFQSRELYIQNDVKTKILDAKPGMLNPNCTSCSVNLLPHLVKCDFNTFTLGQFINQEIRRTQEMTNEDDENSKKTLESFSISFGPLIIYEEDEYLEEEEIEANKAKESRSMFSFFKDLSDSKLTVTDEDESVIFATYLFSHANEIPFSIRRQPQDVNSKVSWKSVLAAREQEEKAKQAAKLVQLAKETGKNDKNECLELIDEDDEDGVTFCDENPSSKGGLNEESASVNPLNGKRKAESVEVTATKAGNQMSIDDDDDDDIVIEEPADIKKIKVD